MKIAKKFMTLALAAALGVGCATVGVGAAPSNTSDLAAVAPSRTSETTVDSKQSQFMKLLRNLRKHRALLICRQNIKIWQMLLNKSMMEQ